MARSVVSRAVVVREKYYWPDVQLNIWTIVMLATAGVLIGIYATFISIQQRFRVGIPWLFPFGITVGGLTVLLIFIEIVLITQRKLLPGVMIIGSFILVVLYITGIIETGIQLYGDPSDVNGKCQRYVDNNEQFGPSVNTLAWLEQDSICAQWKATFAFWIVGTAFLLWMMVMAAMVNQNQYEY
ncbi:1,3-beta-glucan synthase component FKS1 [Neofusicoccum parvum]|uniref:Arginase-like protein n=3 Tax=Neofusicoccum TaxID=407951 RepID=R1GGJ8_BOTPV|nr:hypothetical protein UCRNP2_8224 [Neofusicoccum parvum UCRNP2]GME22079.1 1,3-beta-glucan synthase component FKS1 [Neofusicoccum parvum]GME34761.1 1,3-beta-glucan synthase component FKS1 [Neofusicoccum parvum]